MMLTFLCRLPNAARPVARSNLSFAISGNLEKLPAAGLKKEATYFHARLQSTLTQGRGEGEGAPSLQAMGPEGGLFKKMYK